MIRNAASERQVRAAEPRASTWVAANAGSGKTRVLTDRVARLLLGGVEPQHILCLTYTKAAATEMQNRLFRLLGDWAMMPDAPLRAALHELGDGGALTAADLVKARRLFARALETPGGLRIQTIHSFCATLLRRFPLEARVAPAFREMDDRSAKLLRAEIVEELADNAAPALIAEMAQAFTGDDFSALTAEIIRHRAAFGDGAEAAAAVRAFGLCDRDTLSALMGAVFLGGEAALRDRIAPALQAGKATDITLAQKLAALDLQNPNPGTLAALEGLFLYTGDAKSPYGAKLDRLPTKDCRAALGADLEPLQQFMLRVEAARPQRLALRAAERTATLHRFAAAFLPRYEAAKAARGYLDFDDLIARAKGLLEDKSVAAWVLFRLDGGIDHILVDEAQDTSPDQWRIIELLTAEFTAGEGARPGERTLFVVGDKKQSIYSFQGADVAAFDRKHLAFAEGFRAAGQQFQSLELEYSFRSAPAVLRLVDETFGARFPEAVGGQLSHIAFKETMPGRVDLWPLIAPVKGETDEDWENPVDLISETHHSARLAAEIAEEIGTMIRSGVQIPVDAKEDPSGARPVHAGDFLILVQRRAALFSEIIRACKKAGLPIAGADRLKLGAELAVKDLRALLAFLATPEDDLSLAALLRSPLCGWSEDALYRLAQGRKGFLWEALRDWPDQTARAMLEDLRNQADFLRPFDLIDRALTRHDGRRRLIARLGAEAEDGIDELLQQALAYEETEVPSLTGFLIWLDSEEVEVKRQVDGAGGRIRVMTVHGAKGLEAPIVILPDTADRESREKDEIFLLEDGFPVWKLPKEDSPAPIATARRLRGQRQAEESLRLLYVALTRARCWLIIAGAGKATTETSAGPKAPLDWSWYVQVQTGMQAVGAMPGPAGRLRYETGDWPDPAPRGTAAPAAPPAPLPDWVAAAVPLPPEAPRPISPSNLGGAKALPGEGLDEVAALARGTALHLLLEQLAGLPCAARAERAALLVPDAALCADVLPEAAAVLDNPALAMLFAEGTLAEVGLTAPLDLGRMLGTVDRLVLDADRVLAVDFKTNSVVPTRVEDVPEGLLRQMGAYAEALSQIWLDRRIETAILWTRKAQLMPLPPDIVRAALRRAAIP